MLTIIILSLLGLIRIQAIVAVENIASKKLLTKFKFKEEGYLRQYA